MAHVADEASMIEAFRQGVDIHAQTAAQVFGVPLEQMDSETRRRAKAINFGIIMVSLGLVWLVSFQSRKVKLAILSLLTLNAFLG